MSSDKIENEAASKLPTATANTGANDDTLRQTDEEILRARRQSQPTELAPASVPGYTILRSIGEGAYGSVWLAEEQNTGKQVAIKFYSHRRGLDWSLLNREVEKLSVLYTSRNIVRLIAVGWESDPPYYVMEYLQNGSLAGYLADGSLPAREAVRIAKSVLVALVQAHGSGILHCDLKPANVLLDVDFEPRLCDFGQSRLPYEQNPALGTLFYMAPEQAGTAGVPDARWDVYALGALLYQMLSGAPPFRTPENDELVRAASNLEERLAVYRKVLQDGEYPASLRKIPGVDRRLAEIIERCLQIDPQKRYPNAQAVLDELELRDRQRAKRPLLALGIIGPGLLLAATAPFIYEAMSSALKAAEGNLTQRALESDAHAARILARSLQRELEDRTSVLEQVTKSEQLVAAIESAEANGWTDRKSLDQFLNQQKKVVDERRGAQSRELDSSWFFVAANGTQRWRGPYSADTVDHSYKHRNYFHGQALADGSGEHPRDNVPDDVKPISKPHICFPFVSQATKRYMVAITVPVFDAEGENVIGVLGRTTHLGQLLADYERHVVGQGTGEVDRVVALINARDGKLLDHPWMTPENLKATGSSEPLTVDATLGMKLKQLVTSNREGDAALGIDRDAVYRDPVGKISAEEYGVDWLAAFSPVGKTGWIAVVQERRREALLPIEVMRGGMINNALMALVVAGGLIVLLLYFVKRGLSDRGLRLGTAIAAASRIHSGNARSAGSERSTQR
ncbi:MAG: protein kinase [Planctomycetaceae bacterium]|jgi:eukaryotic-like serine/threonine-protein kinase|nr:protein kinase [Planctomycetaceae bacterium]MBT6485451.1 protein kinase [Planctomycetaceae bacterium]MBT6497247.1 protein kinase [Planctomycetaceae bacterium]